MGLRPQEAVRRVFIFVHGSHDFGDRERLLLQLLEPHLERHASEVEAREAAADALSAAEDAGDHVRTRRLTPRQREVLTDVASGLTDVEIAEHLGIARATVSKRLEAIYERLGVHNRTAAAALLRPEAN